MRVRGRQGHFEGRTIARGRLDHEVEFRVMSTGLELASHLGHTETVFCPRAGSAIPSTTREPSSPGHQQRPRLATVPPHPRRSSRENRRALRQGRPVAITRVSDTSMPSEALRSGPGCGLCPAMRGGEPANTSCSYGREAGRRSHEMPGEPEVGSSVWRSRVEPRNPRPLPKALSGLVDLSTVDPGRSFCVF